MKSPVVQSRVSNHANPDKKGPLVLAGKRTASFFSKKEKKKSSPVFFFEKNTLVSFRKTKKNSSVCVYSRYKLYMKKKRTKKTYGKYQEIIIHTQKIFFLSHSLKKKASFFVAPSAKKKPLFIASFEPTSHV